jgi:hypothetical protein
LNPHADATCTGESRLLGLGEVAGDEGERWYRLEVIAPSLPRGWVSQLQVVQPVNCKG